MDQKSRLGLLIFLSLCIFGTFTSSNESKYKVQQPSVASGCSFYCFLKTEERETLNLDSVEGLSCTHYVYKPRDSDMVNTLANLRLFQQFKKDDKAVKKLYGIEVAPTPREGSRLHMYLTSTEAVAAATVKIVDEFAFDGVYLTTSDIEDTSVEVFSSYMEPFLESLSAELAVRDLKNGQYQKKPEVVLRLPVNSVTKILSKLAKWKEHVDVFYLDFDYLATEDKLAKSVDLLQTFDPDSQNDSISYNTVAVVRSGIAREKIIIGLSAWARAYIVPDGQQTLSHNDHAEMRYMDSRSRVTWLDDGKLPFDELCPLLEESELVHDNDTSTVSLVHNGTWYSFNLAHHESFHEKLEWVSEQEFGGIGLTNLYADDVNGTCGQGKFPLHTFVGDTFKCRASLQQTGDKACTRMCSFDVDKGLAINFTAFQANWCSHILLSSASIEAGATVGISSHLKQAIETFVSWKTDSLVKPSIILTLGANDTNSQWRSAIISPYSRHLLVYNVLKSIDENKLDGVNVAWTLATLKNEVDSLYFEVFLQQLRQRLGKKALIVTVTPGSTFLSRYNISLISTVADHVILEGFNFFTEFPTGAEHHSALLKQANSRQSTVEELADKWIQEGADKSKLIVSVSTLGWMYKAQSFFGNEPVLGGSVDSKYGRKTVNQTEICTFLAKNGTKYTFSVENGVPFMSNDELIVVFDDEKSTQLKSTFASAKNFGGLALFNVEHDNMNGECPSRKPFALLQSMVKHQICHKCGSTVLPRGTNSTRKCRSDFSISCMYRLPKQSELDKLDPRDIPFKKCTELVVGDMLLTGDGEIAALSKENETLLLQISKLATEANVHSLILSFNCMTLKEFDSFLATPASRLKIIKSINKFLHKYGYTGIELRCSGFLKPQNKANFDKFLNEIKNVFASRDPEKCPSTVSLRIPAAASNLNETYEVSTLNSLHHVTLDTFVVERRLSPLYASDGMTIDSIITSWAASGVNKSSILFAVPTHGSFQKLPELGIFALLFWEPLAPLKVFTRREVCFWISATNFSTTANYEQLTASAIGVTSQLTFETPETAADKVQYALREQLGGVAVVALNDDDHLNACGHGQFPILTSSVENTCSV